MTRNLANGEAPKGSTMAARGDGASSLKMTDRFRVNRPRSTQEALGVQNESGLLKAFLQAAVLTLVVFAALTVVPYLLEKQAPSEVTTPPAPTDVAETNPSPPAASPTSPTPPSAETVAKKAPDGLKEAPKLPAKKDIVDILGESGTKSANPKSNPLDKKEDDLFKDLK